MTNRQRAVLEFIAPDRPLSYGGDNHWFFSGGRGPKIYAATGFSLLDKKWIVPLPHATKQPFWLSHYQITDAGRAALVTSSTVGRARRSRAARPPQGASKP